MPPSYTQAPSFFNNIVANQKAREITNSFTSSFLQNYSSLACIGAQDVIRVNKNRRVEEQVNKD